MNPFIYNSPVRGADFYNREKPIQKILRETVTGKSQGSIWITGERQIGKTSLLKHIQSLNETFKDKMTPYGSDKRLEVAFIFGNVQACANEDEFFDVLWQSMKDFFDFKLKKSKDSYTNFINALSEVYTKRKYYIVFLIDEFDAFIETIAYETPHVATAFLAKLSSLLQEVDEIDDGTKTFSCVFAANHDMRELLTENHIDSRGSGLIVEALNLKWFNKFQVKDMATKYLRGNEIQFTDADLELCYTSTQGYPYFTQKMLSLMYETKKEKHSERQFRKIVKTGYGEIFQETIEDWGGDKMPIRTLKKLRDLVGKMNIGSTITKVLIRTLELYLKSKMFP